MTVQIAPEQIEDILTRIHNGASLSAACAAHGLCARTIQRRCRRDPKLRDRFDTAYWIRESLRADFVPHRTLRRYRAGCRCSDCRAANAALQRRYKAARQATQ